MDVAEWQSRFKSVKILSPTKFKSMKIITLKSATKLKGRITSHNPISSYLYAPKILNAP